MKRIYAPLNQEYIESLKAGDEVLLAGVIFTARDLAHRELVKAVKKKSRLPIPLKNQVIYYCGPTVVPKHRVIGSCGPTSSCRMDNFTLDLLQAGLKGMIGKGQRCLKVREAIKKYKAVYFLAIGGAGALLSTKVRNAEVVGYEGFGPEAIYKLEVRDFPLIVGVDCRGKDIFEEYGKK